MTVRAPGAVPPGMPAHLWEAAKRDVRGVIPDWLRSAQENGADAPAHIREVARRAAKAGAGLGMAIAVGTQVDTQVDTAAADNGGAAVTPVAHASPLDTPPGGEAPALAESFRVLDPHGVGDGWLTVEMYQDVVVNEGADATYDVDAFQYLTISDDAGRQYVFKEHHHAAVPKPPASGTDLLIHERGQVHVVENPDGSFSLDTVSYDRSVNGVSDPGPDGGPGEETDTAPPDEVREVDEAGPGWTPPIGLVADPAPAVLDAAAAAPAPLDDGPAAPDPGPAVEGVAAPEPDRHDTGHETGGDPGHDPPDDPGNDPPEASDLAV